MKICTKCKLEKEESEFYRMKDNKDGLCSSCKACFCEHQKEYKRCDKYRVYLRSDKRRKSQRIYRERDKCKWNEYHMLYQREYRRTEKSREYVRGYQNNRCHSNVQCRLARNLRCRLYIALKNNFKAGSAVRDLGCSISFLKQRLEKLFQPGMSWENWGIGKGKWHIDHKYPLSKVDLTDRRQLLKVCHYTNLQPLWAEENLRKHNKIC